jgi:hypothetical protein
VSEWDGVLTGYYFPPWWIWSVRTPC